MPPRRFARRAESPKPEPEDEPEEAPPPELSMPAPVDSFRFVSTRRLKRKVRLCVDCSAVVPAQYGGCHLCRGPTSEVEEDYTIAEASWGPKNKVRRVEVVGRPNAEALKIRLLRED